MSYSRVDVFSVRLKGIFFGRGLDLDHGLRTGNIFMTDVFFLRICVSQISISSRGWSVFSFSVLEWKYVSVGGIHPPTLSTLPGIK